MPICPAIRIASGADRHHRRYHRRSSPKEGHEEFQRLTPRGARVVRNLAAILRVADGSIAATVATSAR